jgi:methyl-accepting chemotaxis protein
VARRLAMTGAVGVVSVGAVAGVSTWGAATQASNAAAMARISNGMSRQWNADMMHDGIRGDVMAARYAGTPGQRQELEVDDVQAKATAIVEHYDAAAPLAPLAVRAQFVQVRPALVTYGQLVVALVAEAGRDKVAARSRLPLFLDRFSDLEEKLGAIDESTLAAVAEREKASESSTGRDRWLILLIGVLALVAFVAVTWSAGRAMLRPLRQLLAAGGGWRTGT